jgi:Uma2 family endonuclease
MTPRTLFIRLQPCRCGRTSRRHARQWRGRLFRVGHDTAGDRDRLSGDHGIMRERIEFAPRREDTIAMFPQLKHKLDYDDLAHAPADGKQYELLDGELFVTPAPNPFHQRASKRLQRQLERYFEEGGLGEVFNAPLDVILTPRDVVEPDLIVVTDARQISRRGIEGPPTIVVDVLSPSTADHDRTLKSKRYEATGVPHYWILDLETQRLDGYRLVDQQYVLVLTATADQPFQHPDWPDLHVDVASLWS